MCVFVRVWGGGGHVTTSLQSRCQLSRVQPRHIGELSDHLVPPPSLAKGCGVQGSGVEPSARGERGEDTARPCSATGGRSHLQRRVGSRARLVALAAAPPSAQPPPALPPARRPQPGTARTWPAPSSGAPGSHSTGGSLRQGTPVARPPRRSRGPPLGAQGARSHHPCAPPACAPGPATMGRPSPALSRRLPGPRCSPPRSL